MPTARWASLATLLLLAGCRPARAPAAAPPQPLPLARGLLATRSKVSLWGCLHAAGDGVGPLILVSVGARADEGRRRPGALVVRLVASPVVPGRAVGVGRRLACLVTGEVLEVLRV